MVRGCTPQSVAPRGEFLVCSANGSDWESASSPRSGGFGAPTTMCLTRHSEAIHA